MTNATRGGSWICLLALINMGPCLLAADEEVDSNASGEQRLAYLTDLLSEFTLRPAGSDRPVERYDVTEHPLMRYSNPVRNFFSDGATFLWLHDHRPVAAITLSIRGEGTVAAELTSLTAVPMICQRGELPFWTPQTGGLVFEPLDGEIAPAETAQRRALQLRKIARQFSFKAHRDEPVELRLLPKPLYHRADEAAGTELALFAYVEATDPEALLLVEAVRDQPNGQLHWKTTLAKMTSVPLTAYRNGSEVWHVPGYWRNPRSMTDPYKEWMLGEYNEPTAADDTRP